MRMRPIWMIICITLTSATIASAQLEWHTWLPADGGNGHQYALVDSAAGWDTQQAVAQAQGAYLATFTSQTENAWAKQTFLLDDNRSFWFGLFQPPGTGDEPAGGWQWVTGEDFDFSNWETGEPNDYNTEDFAQIYGRYPQVGRDGGTWNDAPGDLASPAILERNAPASHDSPEPATWLLLGATAALAGLRRRKR